MALNFIRTFYELLKRKFFLILWISIVVYIFNNSFIFYYTGRQFHYLRNILGIGLCISRGSGSVLNLCCTLILLPLCKKINHLFYRGLSKTWPGLFFFWLERIKSFHMTVAITLFIFGVVHSVSHFCNLWNFSRNYNEEQLEINMAAFKNQNPLILLLTTQPGVTGTSMLVITTAMSLTSLRVIRRKVYNAFWYAHQLYLPFMVLFMVHPLSGVLKQQILEETEPNINSSQIILNNNTINDNHTPRFVAIKSKTWLWMAVPLCCFFLDLIWRIFSRNLAAVDIIQVVPMPGRILSVKMTSPHAGFLCRPGQYVLLQCVDISLLEWHPFTVVKVPIKSDNTFIVWIKVTGDWTEALENLVISTGFSKLRMLVDGPMASPMEGVGRNTVAICVAAGVGVTPFVPILHQMLSEPRGKFPGRLHLIWIVREERELTALSDLLTRCLQQLRSANRPDRLHIQIHVTYTQCKDATHTMVNEKGITYVLNKTDEKKILLTPDMKAKVEREEDSDNYSIAREYPLIGCRMTQGRPYWDEVFGYWVHLYPREHLNLYCCGPKKLVNQLRNQCKEVSHTTNTQFTFIHERFS